MTRLPQPAAGRRPLDLLGDACGLLAGAIGLALGLETLDKRIGYSGLAFLLFPGPPEGARSF